MDIAKEKAAIKCLKSFQPRDINTGQNEKYYLCYSGGKDSDVILALAKLAGVEYEAVHNLTTVDAPETVRHVKAQPEVKIDTPDLSMWQLIVKKRMPPTRICRYCCAELKERGGKRRTKITGVRWAESINRQKNQAAVVVMGGVKSLLKMIEEAELDFEYDINPKGSIVFNDDNDDARALVDHCYRTRSVMVNPIVDWSDADVWDFLYHYGIKSNPLYEAKEVNGTYCPFGDNRVGCIGCPMQGKKGMIADFIRYPKYRDNYLRAFKRMLDKRIADGLPPFANEYYGKMTAEKVMMWWVGDDPRQLSLFGLPDYLKGAPII